MIHIHEVRSALEPWAQTSRKAAFRPGILVGDLDIPAGCMIAVNGLRAGPNASVRNGDHVTFCKDVRAPAVAAAGGLGLEGVIASIPAWVLAVGYAAVLYFANRFFQPSLPGDRGANDSATYAWAGIGTSRTEGETVQIIYGRHATGGMVISEWVSSTPTGSVYNAVLSLGEGPVHMIGDKTEDNTTPFVSGGAVGNELPKGMRINDNPAENFHDVQCWVRMGNIEQEVIPGLEDTRTQQASGADLLDVENESGTQPVPSPITELNFKTSTADDHFDDFAVSIDVTTAYDSIEPIIEFVQGLYRVTNNGNLVSRSVFFAIRYRELDAGNNPIVTGGPESDGWVRVTPEWGIGGRHVVTAKSRSPLFHQFNEPLFDPQTYAHPTKGEAVTLDGVGEYWEVATPDVPASIATKFDKIPEVTIAGWFRLTDTVAPADNTNCVSWFIDGGIPTGVKVGFVTNFEAKHVPIMTVGTGGGTPATFKFFQNVSSTFTMPQDEWHHIVWAYKRNWLGGTKDRYQLWVDGVQVHYVDDQSTDMESAGITTPIRLGADGEPTAGNFAAVDIDELRIDLSEWSSLQVIQDYANGLGVHSTNGPPAHMAAPLASWPFDVDGASTAVGFTNTFVAAGGAALTTSGGGFVSTTDVSSNTRKTMKVRFQVVRNCFDSTNGQVFDDASLNSLIFILDEPFVYPGIALVYVTIPASEQLNTSAPDIVLPVSGRLAKRWDGNNPNVPVFLDEWSPNPAWILLEYVLNDFYGAGQFFKPLDINDLDGWLAWATYCENMLYDQMGRFNAITQWTDIEWTTTGSQTGGGTFGEMKFFLTSAGFLTFSSRYAVEDYIGVVGVNTVLGKSEFNTPIENTLNEAFPTLPGAYRIKSTDPGAETVTLEALNLSGEPWDTGTLLSAHVAGGAANLTGNIEGRGMRFEFNGVLDRPMGAWDTMLELAAVGHAIPIRLGNKLRVKYERPRDPVDIVSMASIIEGSFEVGYGGEVDRPNVMTVDFTDRRQNWERAAVRVEHDSVQNPSSLNEYREAPPQFVRGITSLRQAMTHGAFQLNVFAAIQKSGRYKTAAESLPHEPGDVVVLSHDLLNWGVGCRVGADSDGSTLTITLDEDVTLAVGKTYEIEIRSRTLGKREVVNVDMTAYSLPVTVSAGTGIVVEALPQLFLVLTEDPAIFVAIGEDEKAQITSVTYGDELEFLVEWTAYDAAVYDTDDVFGEILSATAGNAPEENARVIPQNVTGVALDQKTTGAAGGYAQVIVVSWAWQKDEDNVSPARFNVHAHSGDSLRGQFEKVAEADGTSRTAEFSIPMEPGDVLTVVVQPVSYSGARYSPIRCSGNTMRLEVVAPRPTDAASLGLTIDGLEATYTWTRPVSEEPLANELRRGGWLLGQPIGSTSADELVTGNWAGGDNGDEPLLNANPDLYLRHRSDGGAYSDFSTVRVNVDLELARTLAQYTREKYEWHRVAWTGADSDAIPPVKTNLTIATDWQGIAYLEVSGSNLTATYETSTGDILDNQQRKRSVFIEAYVGAWNVDETPVEDLPDFPAGSVEMSGLTTEGWINANSVRPLRECSLFIEVEIDASGEWLRYTPGVYKATTVKFRIQITRPNTSCNVRVYQFHTRVELVPTTTPDHEVAQLVGESRMSLPRS